MKRASHADVIAAIASAAVLLTAGQAAAATVERIASFGNNPTGIGMYLYTPSSAVSHPPILIGVHACHGKGTDVCASGTPFAAQADKYGFLLVCPSAVSSDGCWDVHSSAVLTHNGGGDASGIISMVNYVVQNRNGDASRVFVAGHSSGGMMTNVLIGSYPDVFKAGAAYAGVPFACFAQGSVDSSGWNSSCANGNVSKTGPQWGDLVRAAYPGFTGARPRMQLWHGTADATVNFHNFGEEIKQWTNVLGVSETPATTENNAIQSGWIRTRYVNGSGVVEVEAIQETGQPHNLVLDLANAIRFFGLDGSMPVPDGGAGGSGGSTGVDGGVDAAGGGRGGAGGAGGVAGGAAGDGRTRRRGRRRRHVSHRRKCRDEHRRRGGWRPGGSIREHGNGRGTAGTSAGSSGRGGMGGTAGMSARGGDSGTGTGGTATTGGTGGARGGDAGTTSGTAGVAGNAGSVGADSAGCSCNTVCALDRNWLSALLLTLALVFRPRCRASWRATTSRDGRATRRQSDPP